MADEVVLAVKAVEPQPWIEVHCHGGPAVVDLLLESIASDGARVCSAAEFQRFSDGDILRTLAGLALAEARTTRTAAILLDQYHGAFRMAVQAILDAPGTPAAPLFGKLGRHVPLGRHLTRPWEVVIAGAPNVGKSSLVNALAGYERSIVSPVPGTTRDVVTTAIALDGWPIDLADTAGLRSGNSDLEAQGMERARSAAATADLCLWVLDASAEPVWPELTGPVLLVVNKVDLPPAWDLGQAQGAVHVSARTSVGLPQLAEAIVCRLVPDPPAPGEAVPYTAELCDAIRLAETHLSAGRIVEARSVLAGLLESPGGARP